MFPFACKHTIQKKFYFIFQIRNWLQHDWFKCSEKSDEWQCKFNYNKSECSLVCSQDLIWVPFPEYI